MQTRKRAKSVSFGKSNKENIAEKKAEEKTDHKVEAKKGEDTPKIVRENPELSHAAKKVQDYETSSGEVITPIEEEKPKKEEVEEVKPVPSEPSSSGILKEPVVPSEVSPPAEEVSTTDVAPPSDFLSDATTTTPVTSPVEEKPAETLEQAPMIVESTPANADAIIAPATDANETVVPQTPEQPVATVDNSELSPTPPSSAFTLQGNNIDSGGRRKNVILYFLLVAFLSFALGLGVMASISHFGLLPNKLPSIGVDPNLVNNLNPMKPSPTTVPTKAPTPTPTEKPVDLKAYKVSVLNGSGIKGKAAEVRTSLTTAGYTVISAANADRSDYLTTQVVAKKSVPQEYLDKLESELKKSFEVDTLSSMPNEANQTADVIITIGKKAAN